jgi:hypothetical protein
VDIDQVTKALGAEGVPCGPVLWPQSYKEDVYRLNVGQGRDDFPFHSREYSDPKQTAKYKGLALPNAMAYQQNTFFTVCHPLLDPKHMKLIAKGIKKVLDAYAK